MASGRDATTAATRRPRAQASSECGAVRRSGRRAASAAPCGEAEGGRRSRNLIQEAAVQAGIRTRNRRPCCDAPGRPAPPRWPGALGRRRQQREQPYHLDWRGGTPRAPSQVQHQTRTGAPARSWHLRVAAPGQREPGRAPRGAPPGRQRAWRAEHRSRWSGPFGFPRKDGHATG